ncbi:MAG: ribosome biogenesis GTPase Der [Dehalococcoidia bacterium]|nr:ribosome biogenesis GTPase Der [Dehalococcoidia bacterium]
MTLPIVAIVGRPNVGKSSLFNRLIGHQRAIVEDVPGTTRDRIYGDASWGGRNFTVVDTGGLELTPGTVISQKVKEQVESAIAEASVIVFVVDVEDGVIIPDQEVAEILRRSRKQVLLAVNKADNEKRRGDAVQFFEMGLGDPLPISAHHGLGVAELLDSVLDLLPAAAEEEAPPVAVKIAIVGRPNVGKSALVNAILGEERVIVDGTPGTTRDAIDTLFRYKDQPVVLIDTAGIRRRGRVDRGVERYSVMRAQRAIDRADIVVLVTDTEEVIAAQDTHIAGYARDAYKGLIYVVNKWDLAREKGTTVDECTSLIKARLRFFTHFPILFVSALSGKDVDKVLAAAMQVQSERQKRVSTAVLNKLIQDVTAAHAPPTTHGKRLKVLYATQSDVSPPEFVFFVNDPKIVHFSYRRYLENQVRHAFGFEGTAIRMIFRGRSQEEA